MAAGRMDDDSAAQLSALRLRSLEGDAVRLRVADEQRGEPPANLERVVGRACSRNRAR